MREITCRRVTAPAMPVTIEESRAFLRVPGNQIADLVSEPVRNVSRSRMQKNRDIRNLLRRQRESRHPAIQPTILDNRTNRITLVVVQHQRRPHKIGPALSKRTSAAARADRWHENSP